MFSVRSIINKLVPSFTNCLHNNKIKSMSSVANIAKKLTGKVAIVTASTEGIGFAISKRLAEDGASVVISSRKQTNVDKAVEELKKLGLNVSGITCHVGKAEDRKKLVDYTIEKNGGLDILISNAGTNPVMCQVLDTPEEAWDKIFEVNVKSALLMTQQVLPHLQKRGGGSIVYVSSIAGYQPLTAIGAYSVSKTALLGLTKATAVQCSGMNIRVNCICPGIIRTKFSKGLVSYPGADEMLNAVIPLRRIGNPDECAGTVSFLCSDDSSYITGESIVVAGGYFSRL